MDSIKHKLPKKAVTNRTAYILYVGYLDSIKDVRVVF